jgi:hypothetical protein
MRISFLYCILLSLLMTAKSINAQESISVDIAVDTIVYLGGRSIAVNVANVTSSKVFYTNIDENTIFETDRKQVEKIVYRTGRVDILNRPVFQMISEDDWKNIFITEESGEVAGLHERGPVEVTAAASRNRKSTIRNAEIRLKRQASALKANLILVTSTEFRGGYGDVPSITMKGIAYGFEPLPEEEGN